MMMTSAPVWVHPAVHALAWTLVNFLWQGLLVGLLLTSVLGLINRRAANLRYIIACSALAIMTILPVLTLRHFLTESDGQTSRTNTRADTTEAGNVVQTAAAVLVQRTAPSLNVVSEVANSLLPWMLIAWVVGVILLSSRLWIGLIAVRSIRSFASPLLMGDVPELFHKVGRRLEMNFAVQLLTSAFVEVPTVVGWLRPAVIMPFGCLAGLSKTQIEALLAHELAHIKRHDYLVNVLQMVTETMFFYHPLVWWVSKQIRREREYCCDDLALTVSENPLAYAKALSSLEEQRSSIPSAALGADGGSLVLRVRRLLGCDHMPPFTRMFAGTSLSITLLVTIFTCAATQGSWAVGSIESKQQMTGYANLSAQNLADLQHYGVTAAFANSINAIGLGQASVEQLVRLNQYGVDPQFAADVKRAGLVDLTLEDVIRFHQYGVSPEYVAGMYAMGYHEPDEILQLQQQGISVLQVNDLHRVGYRTLSPTQIASQFHPE